jgi:hypothetical protein
MKNIQKQNRTGMISDLLQQEKGEILLEDTDFVVGISALHSGILGFKSCHRDGLSCLRASVVFRPEIL